MFDISTVNKRYFNIKLSETVLDVEPPKLKALKKITSLRKSGNENEIEDLCEAIQMILNKNKTGYIVSMGIIEELDLDQMNEILTAYFAWINGEKNNPN